MGPAPRLCELTGLGFVALLAVFAIACGGTGEAPITDVDGNGQDGSDAGSVREIGNSGGGLVVALASGPRSFNPLFARDANTIAVVRRLNADLIHIDRFTRETEPALADSWEVSEDGRLYTLVLREGLRFSDGEPVDVEDVLFTFRVYLDEAVASPNRDLLIVGGEPIAVRAIGPRRLEFELAEPYAVGARLFDSIAILPRHLLEEAYLAGELESAWGLDASPDRMAGLGPFQLREHLPGERIVLERNPHYWRRDEAGNPLPYLDTLTFLIVPDREAQVIRFQSGDTHIVNRLSAENFNLLVAQADRRGYRLEDLGPDLTFTLLFFNLNDLEANDPVGPKQRWFRDLGFRRAISCAIDRAAITDLVFEGRATALASHVSPGLERWFNAEVRPPERSLETARTLLEGAGFRWDGEDRLIDRAGEPVAFSLVTNSSNRQRVEIMTVVAADLAELGIEVQPVHLDFGALVDRVLRRHEYDACVLALGGGDADPNSVMNVLSSDGPQHIWRLAGDSGPEPWQREVDELMERQLVALDPEERRRLYGRVQELVADNLPFIPLVSPHLLVGAQREVGNFRPAILDHQTLWNADEIFLRSTPTSR